MKDALVGSLLFFFIWYVLWAIKVVNPLFLPPPHDVAVSIFLMLATGDLSADILFTLSRLARAYLLSILIGIPLGLLLGFSRRLNSMFGFIIEFFRALPIPSLIPLFILFFGVGDTARIAIIYVAGSLVVLVNTCYGVRNAEKIRLHAAMVMRMSAFSRIYKVYLPEALPHIFAGLKVSLSLSLAICIVVEILMGTNGLGALIYNAQLAYRIREMYAAILVAGCLGYSLNWGFSLLERKIVHWRGWA